MFLRSWLVASWQDLFGVEERAVISVSHKNAASYMPLCNIRSAPAYRPSTSISQAFETGLTSTRVSDINATHLVASIEWGSRSVISARVPSEPSERASADNQFQMSFATFVSAIEGMSTSGQPDNDTSKRINTATLVEVTAYSEMFEEGDGILLQDFQEAQDFLQVIPLLIKDTHLAKGWPIMYSLIPVEIAGYLLGVQIPQVRQILHPMPEIIDACFNLLDGYLACERKLDTHHTTILANSQMLPPDAQHALACSYEQAARR